ncbi:MAG: SH3 domain-containing protein, partial [Candidatus Cloacimonadaceae bacterium]|nr:SH3 domain-containing protein [Candidatus Cloacimonadaceae bacterium]
MKLKHIILVLMVWGFCGFPLVLIAQLRNYAAPTTAKGVSAEMNTAEFWIAKHPNPDKVILDQKTIRAMNRRIAQADDSVNLMDGKITAIDGKAVRAKIQDEYEQTRKQNLSIESKPVTADYWNRLYANLNLENIPDKITPQFGILIAFTAQRLLPTNDNINSRTGNTEFDQIQNTAFETGSPHLVLHRTKDGQWLYCISKSYRGWFAADAMALSPEEDWQQYNSPTSFITITSPKAGIWKDRGVTQYHGFIRLGNTLPLVNETSAGYQVLCPLRKADGSLSSSSYW